MLSSIHTRTIRRMVRRDEFSPTDWLKIIGERIELLKPHLEKMNLKRIGLLKVSSYSHRDQQMLEADVSYTEVVGPFGLSARAAFPQGEGFYSDQTWSKVEHFFDPPGSSPAAGAREKFWVLARSGSLLAVDVLWHSSKKHDERVRVKRVTIHELPLPELIEHVGIEYKEMWLQLGRMARRWHKEREALLCDSRHLQNIVEAEEEMYMLATSRN